MNKRGAAMVEMGDHIACNTVIQCLGGQQLFGSQIDFRFVLFGLCIFIFLGWVHGFAHLEFKFSLNFSSSSFM